MASFWKRTREMFRWGSNKVNPPAKPKEGRDQRREKITTDWGSNIAGRQWFLPWVGDITEETQEMRTTYRTMLRDPIIKSGLFTKVLGVASLDLQVQPAKPKDKASSEKAEFIKWNVERLPMGAVGAVQALTVGTLMDGFGVCEPVWEVERKDPKYRGRVVAKALKDKDTRELYLEGDQYRNVTVIRTTRDNQCWSAKDFIISQYMPIFGKPTGMSDFRAIYADYWMQDAVRKLRAIHVEKYTSPFLKGTYTNPNDQPALEDALENAKANTWICVPETVQIEAMSIAGGGQSDYEAFLQSCMQRILIGLTGAYLQILEGQVSDGRGSASVSKGITELYQWYLVVMVQEALNRQWVPKLIDWNYEEGGDYPRITLGGVNEYEQQSLLNLFSGAQQIGLQISKSDAISRLGIQPPDENDPDDVLAGPGQQAMGGIPGMGGDMGMGGAGGMPPDQYDPNAQQMGYDQGGGQFAEEVSVADAIRYALQPVERANHAPLDSLDDVRDFDEADWRQIPDGPRGGKRWQHVKTGGIEWSDTNPGGSEQGTPTVNRPLASRKLYELADQFTGDPAKDQRVTAEAQFAARKQIMPMAKEAARHQATAEESSRIRSTWESTSKLPDNIKARVGADLQTIAESNSPGIIRRAVTGFGRWLIGLGAKVAGSVVNDLRVAGKKMLSTAKNLGGAAGLWAGSLLLAGAIGAAPAYFLPGMAIPLALKLTAGLAAGAASVSVLREGMYRTSRRLKNVFDPQTRDQEAGHKFRAPFIGTSFKRQSEHGDDWDWGLSLA